MRKNKTYTELYLAEFYRLLNKGKPKVIKDNYFNTNDYTISIQDILSILLNANLGKLQMEQYRFGESYRGYYQYIHKIAELNAALEIHDQWKIYCVLEEFIAYRVLFRQEIYYNVLRLLEKYTGDQHAEENDNKIDMANGQKSDYDHI